VLSGVGAAMAVDSSERCFAAFAFRPHADVAPVNRVTNARTHTT
jgi:hypothetical protein